MVTLCFDFGNTRLKYAVFENDQFANMGYLENDDIATAEQLVAQYKPNKAILSSVINHNPAFETTLASTTNFHKLSHNSKLNFSTPIGKAETIGADRLALCAATARFYGNHHNLIIALGSCITYNYLNLKNEFLGGSISPGLQMRFKAMHNFTAKLPIVDPEIIVPLIGDTTANNLQSGVILGISHEIDGFINAYKQKFTKFNAILTGGDSTYFVPHLKNKIFADRNLIFKGLYAISEIN
jgi:type III pantothenate kinase